MDTNQILQLVNDIEKCMSSMGIMYRIFYRQKSSSSLSSKIEKNPSKYGESKKIQDIVGIRIALYFVDDIDIAKTALIGKYEYLKEHSEIDPIDNEVFKAVRYNLIFKLPEFYDVSYVVDPEHLALVDRTFELQIRTVLSEGWHEVDHDLRYKCKEDWSGFDKENRAFNGVYATLETSEWTMLKLFEDLAYKHYKSGNVRAMINNKFRLRMNKSDLDEPVIDLLKSNLSILKMVFRYDRVNLLKILSDRPRLPLSLASLVLIINLDAINNDKLSSITPTMLNRWWNLH